MAKLRRSKNRRANRRRYLVQSAWEDTTKSERKNRVSKKPRTKLTAVLKNKLRKVLKYPIIKFILAILSSMQRFVSPIEVSMNHEKNMRSMKVKPIVRSPTITSTTHSQSNNSWADEEPDTPRLNCPQPSDSSFGSHQFDTDDRDISLSSSIANEEVAAIFNNASPSTASSDDENYYYDATNEKIKRHSDIEMCYSFLSKRQECSLGDECSSAVSDSNSCLVSPVHLRNKPPDDHCEYTDDKDVGRSKTPMPIARPGHRLPNYLVSLDDGNRSTETVEISDEMNIRHWHDTFSLDKSMLFLQIGCYQS